MNKKLYTVVCIASLALVNITYAANAPANAATETAVQAPTSNTGAIVGGVAAATAVAGGITAAVLSSRNSSSDNDTPTNSHLSWTNCPKDMNVPCQLATVKVPLDYNNPAVGTVELKVLRVLATDQQQKIGTLFINFGAPLEGHIDAFTDLYNSDSDFFQSLHKYFDLITFNSRGSIPALKCNNAQAKKIQGEMLTLDLSKQQNVAKYISLQKQKFALCVPEYGNNLAYFGVQNTVRDQDLLRQLLGLQQINYFGDSYGTMIGAQYLMKYPKHVRAMILDGNIPPDYDNQVMTKGTAKTDEAVLEYFFNECSKSAKCAIQSNPKQIYLAVLNMAELNPIPSTIDNQKLTAGMLLNLMNPSVTSTTPTVDVSALGYGDLNLWQYIAKGLYQIYNDHDATMLVALFDAVYAYDPKTQMADAGMSPLGRAASCLDFNNLPTTSQALQLSSELNQQFPLVGGSASTIRNTICLGWPIPAQPLPKFQGSILMPPVLIVGNLHDPATPLVWSQEIAKRIPNSSLLTWTGVGHTAIFNETGTCIKNYEINYLLTLKLPPKGTVCSDFTNPFEL